MYRVADLKVKREANSLINNRFLINKIDLTLETCSCKGHLAYVTCKHICKVFSLYDILFDQVKFFEKLVKDETK